MAAQVQAEVGKSSVAVNPRAYPAPVGRAASFVRGLPGKAVEAVALAWFGLLAGHSSTIGSRVKSCATWLGLMGPGPCGERGDQP